MITTQLRKQRWSRRIQTRQHSMLKLNGNHLKIVLNKQADPVDLHELEDTFQVRLGNCEGDWLILGIVTNYPLLVSNLPLTLAHTHCVPSLFRTLRDGQNIARIERGEWEIQFTQPEKWSPMTHSFPFTGIL